MLFKINCLSVWTNYIYIYIHIQLELIPTKTVFSASLWEVSRRNKKVEERDSVCVTVWEKQISLTPVCTQVLRIWNHFKILVINTIMIMMAMLSLFRHIHFACFFSLYFWISYHHSVSLGPFSFKYWEKKKPLEIVGYELGVFFI